MKIAILGWGSLIWNPEKLNFNRELGWIKTGPVLPIEFSRISRNGRLTLVITKSGSDVQTLYSISTEKTIENAIKNLKEREGTTTKNIGYYIKNNEQFFPTDFEFKQSILDWINKNDIDAVIWTDLNENWKDKTQNRLEYLNTLDVEKKQVAKEYISNTPKQIKTVLRTQIEDKLNWK